MIDKKPIGKMIELSEDLGLYEEQIIINNIEISECTMPEGDCFYCLNPNCPLINRQRSRLTLNDLRDEKDINND